MSHNDADNKDRHI